MSYTNDSSNLTKDGIVELKIIKNRVYGIVDIYIYKETETLNHNNWVILKQWRFFLACVCAVNSHKNVRK